MDTIAALSEVDIPNIILPTQGALYPLLEAHKSDIESVPRKTFKYGKTERHQLDVYYPLGGNSKVPVLFFVYGGGFSAGDRVFDPPSDLVHRNIGSFYAKRGILTVIADYRLVPHVTFPGQAEDIKDALIWILNNAEIVAEGSDIQLDTENVFLAGHSAGGANVSTIFLAPDLLPRNVWPRVKGLILMGGAFHVGKREYHFPPLIQYYGSEEEMKEKEPLALLQQASQKTIDSLPKIFMLRSEREPGIILDAHSIFLKALNERLSTPVKKGIMLGHNHVSPAFSLGSGEGEEFGEQITEWIRYLVITNQA